MFSLSTIKNIARRPPQEFAARLEWLVSFGRPSLEYEVGFLSGRTGWFARIYLNVTVPGASVSLKSDEFLSTPEEAINQLIERMQAVYYGGENE